MVSVSSEAHRFAPANALEDWNSEKSYDPWMAYGRSKLANVLFASELARRVPKDSNVFAAALHPGICSRFLTGL